MKMAAQIRQLVVNGSQLLLQGTPYLSGGVGGGIGGLRLNQIDDRLRLGQSQLPVEECPLGKFPPLGRSGSGGKQRLQSGGQHRRGTVTLQLHRVLSRVAVGGSGTDRHTLVDDTPFLIPERTENQLPVGSLGKGLPGLRCKHLFRNGNASVSREPENADGTDLPPGGYGGDDMGHGNPSLGK